MGMARVGWERGFWLPVLPVLMTRGYCCRGGVKRGERESGVRRKRTGRKIEEEKTAKKVETGERKKKKKEGERYCCHV